MLTRLTLSDFRNYEDALVVPRAPFVVLTGENGAGKTNILEAVSLLAPGRGLRGAALSQMARQGGSGAFGVAAQVDGVTMGTGISVAAPDRRQATPGLADPGRQRSRPTPAGRNRAPSLTGRLRGAAPTTP